MGERVNELHGNSAALIPAWTRSLPLVWPWRAFGSAEFLSSFPQTGWHARKLKWEKMVNARPHPCLLPREGDTFARFLGRLCGGDGCGVFVKTGGSDGITR